MRLVFVIVLLIAGVACGEEPIQLEWTTTGDENLFIPDDNSTLFVGDSWKPEECPEGFQPLVVEMPPSFPYGTVEFACGRIAQ